MKKRIIVLSAAALALAACTVEVSPEISTPSDSHVGPVSFTASLESDSATKAVLDLNGCSKPQTFWENGDAIAGYKLVKVVCHNVELSSTAPKMGITTLITASAAHPADSDYVTGGEVQTWAAGGGKVYTYSLSGTAANTRYYLYGKAKGAIDWITLTYEPV